VGSLETEFSFLVREDPLHKTIAPPLEYRFQPLDIHEVNANTKDHRRSAKMPKMPKVPKIEKTSDT